MNDNAEKDGGRERGQGDREKGGALTFIQLEEGVGK